MLELKDISAGYGRINALSGVGLKVDAGRVVALLGANGAGKTTTLNCISRVVALTSGEIHFEGQRVDRLASEDMVARGICQVPEGREIFAKMSVRENLEIGAHLRRDTAVIKQDLDRVCEYFPRLRQRFAQEAGTLSGGEQQMLLIARALMGRPKLLLLDEPSLGLSPLLVEQIFAIIRQLNKEGLTILLVEQNARIALNISDYAYILENGEIAFEGHSADLVRDDRVRQAIWGRDHGRAARSLCHRWSSGHRSRHCGTAGGRWLPRHGCRFAGQGCRAGRERDRQQGRQGRGHRSGYPRPCGGGRRL